MTHIFNKFADCDDLAKNLAAQIAKNLRLAIDKTNRASIALSGGSTPKKMLQYLAQEKDINWSNVDVTLVDERFVDENSPRSNAKMIKENLLHGEAKKAKFFPLFLGSEYLNSEAIEKITSEQNHIKHPFDVVVLGMGLDGHTASFFPNTISLEKALSDEGPAMAVNATDGEERITLTLPYLLQTNNLYLHIEGEEKQQVLEKAMQNGSQNEMPIRAVLRQNIVPLNIYSCP